MFLRLFKIKNLLSNSLQRDTLISQLTSIIWEPHFRIASDTLETWLTFLKLSEINNMPSNSLQMVILIFRVGTHSGVRGTGDVSDISEAIRNQERAV